MFLIRDSKGNVYNRVKNPAAVYDAEDFVLIGIGEREEMEYGHKIIQDQYKSFGLYNIAENILLIDLPKDQEEIDKVYQISGYIRKLHEEILKKMNWR